MNSIVYDDVESSWDNQISTFQMSWRHQVPKHETQNILLSNLGSKHSLVIEFDQCTRFSK